MKKIFSISLICFSLFICNNVFAQGLFNKIKEKVKQRTDQKTDQAIDKSLDKAEDATKTGSGSTNNINNNNNNSNNNNANNTAPANAAPASIQSYANYDFVPGEKIIFQSALADESVGEIPSQFTLTKGQVDIQQEDGENVIHIPKGDFTVITPRFTAKANIPDAFTIEFDFKDEAYGVNHVNVDFGFNVGTYGPADVMTGIGFNNSFAVWTLGNVNYPDDLLAQTKNSMQWHHFAIAVNKNAGKAYIDQFRVANVNNLAGKHEPINIEFIAYDNSYIKNIRIAAGGIDIYKKVSTDGKIVMHGILFDVDKATLKPESMGSINQINNLLKKDASLKFEIDGHTDNSGTSAHNLTLSQQRSDAVKAQLVKMGIDASRLTAKGFGDSKPISDNTTPEGKGNNRRVEFVKM